MKLNSWQRLWIFVSVLWLAFWGVGFGYLQHATGIASPVAGLWGFVLFGLLPLILLYAVGWGIARMRRGSRDE